MWDMEIGGGLVNIAGYAISIKELHWLFSVLAGVISASFVKEYAKLNSKQKLEWNNRGSPLSMPLSQQPVLYISCFFQVSIGYFLTDLAMIFYHYPALGGMEYVVHHGLSMFSIIQSLLCSQAQIYILMVLFTESTTPFVNLRWYLDVAGLKNSKLYIYNGVALFFGWLVARIIIFLFFFYHMFIHFDQVKKVVPLGFYSLLTIPPTMAMMNVFWFWKIARGMLKILSKAKHKL
ncbi:UNVERIFIED_CONTAM: hypothetical protein Sangu_0409200 [Sesamum angustifolium]|uniref:TLC domain-containing protein n=1 Tax=Sesamum angustifolium TaxID=2727405 RepID=A0AAW2QSI8_9LAMI